MSDPLTPEACAEIEKRCTEFPCESCASLDVHALLDTVSALRAALDQARPNAAELAKAFWFKLHPRDVQSEHGWRSNAPAWTDAMIGAEEELHPKGESR